MSLRTFRPRDQLIIDLVIRYRMMTNDVIGLLVMPTRSPNAVTKVTARLCSRGLLTRYTLIPPEAYFRLGVFAINSLGLPQRNSTPLGPQSLPIEYATLIYATKSQTQRRRLTPQDMVDFMPWLPTDLSQSPYCLDSQGQLTLVSVDLGGSPQHVARKVSTSAYDRLDIPQISELASISRFQIAVLTTSNDKAKAIAKALQMTGCSDAVRVHLVVIPKLSFLLLRSH